MKRSLFLVLALVAVLSLPLAASASITIGTSASDSLNAVEPWTEFTLPSPFDRTATAPVVGGSFTMVLGANMPGTVFGLDLSTPGTVVFTPALLGIDAVMEIRRLDGANLGAGALGELMSFELAVTPSGDPSIPEDVVITVYGTSKTAVDFMKIEPVDSSELNRVLITTDAEDTIRYVTVAPALSASILSMTDLRVYVPSSSNPIPEPSTLACWLLLGLTCVGARWRRRKSA